MKYLTLGTLWKNELPYAQDFLTYHRFVGVEHFVIFERDPEALKAVIGQPPDVEIISFPDVPGNVHAVAWSELIEYNKGKTKFLALIDADQTLVPVQTTDVKEVLKNYEGYGALQLNWSTFGSSGHIEKIPGSLYERFTKRAKLNEPINNHTQFICQPDKTLGRGYPTHDPHHPRLMTGQISVNTNFQEVKGPFNDPPLHDKLYISHFINKSEAEWKIKNNKGRADIFNQKMPYDLFAQQEAFANVEEESRVLDLWKLASKT